MWRIAVVVAVVLPLWACGSRRTTVPASGSSGSASSGSAAAAAAATGAPILLDRGVACVIARSDRPHELLDIVDERAPVAATRAMALALVDRAKREGDSPVIDEVAWGVHALGPLDDVEGLRKLFAITDAIQGLDRRLLDEDIAFRARAGLPVEHDRARLAIVRETAIAGDVTAAATIYDHEITPDDVSRPYDVVAQVEALAALGRTKDIPPLIQRAAEKDRTELAAVWLVVALRQGKPVAEPVKALVTELRGHGEELGWMAISRAFSIARRAHRVAELAPVRDYYVERIKTADKTEVALIDRVVIDMLDRSDPEWQPMVGRMGSSPYSRVQTVPLAEALDLASRAGGEWQLFARVWARALTEGADAAFAQQFVAAACKGVPPPAAAITPTAADATLHVVVDDINAKDVFECHRSDARIRLVRGKEIVDEQQLESKCTGACTNAERRAGAAELARIEKAIQRGEATESQTDYNFTDCLLEGTRAGRIERVGDRDVAILLEHYIGPHDVDKDRFLVAFEVCGKLHVSSPFGGRYAGGWTLAEIHVQLSADQRELQVLGASDTWRGIIYRASLPACPGDATEEINETE
jgi:hypothetical protein